MITHLSEFRNRQIPTTDVCIIGAGAAGLELAKQLNRSSISVTLLESGFEEFNWETQKLCRFHQIGLPIRASNYLHPFELQQATKTEIRLRQFGGTLNIWGRRWKPQSPAEFEQKTFLRETGWPISYEELYPYYVSIANEYHVQEVLQRLEFPADEHPLFFNYPCFSVQLSVRELDQTKINHDFHNPLFNSTNIKVVLGANVVDISLSQDLTHITQLLIRDLDGQETTIFSRFIILACGTLENARLLLCSNSQVKAGIGNQYDLVGKTLMDHPQGYAGILKLHSHFKSLPDAFLLKTSRKRIHFEISMHPYLLKLWDLPNHAVRLKKKNDTINIYDVRFFLEQLPNVNSRVFLTDELDKLGMPILGIDWKFRDLDKSCFKSFVNKFQTLISANKIGNFFFEEQYFNMEFLSDACHQMGTTRMALSPKDGVVDPNCKVFGIDNLFVIGSSVFPYSGNANPTFTIFALARRLAHHLKSLIKY